MTSEWKRREAGYSDLQGVCPYVDWALGSGSRGFFPHTQKLRVPVMLRLDRMLPRDFASGDSFFPDARGRALWRNEVRVPAIYTQPDWSTRSRIVCTAVVTRWFFRILEERKDIRARILRITLGLPLREDSLPLYQAWNGEGAR